ncbi:2-phenylethanol ABC transporter ATP-binding protein [Malaciobacter pacificus]|uniref:PQQ-dependent alcohol dehydrogenase-associated ABC transporter, ATP-binding protein n=1 Tax=Malaciobacter pacificus TaxID=1080223 RepID=A0A5C2H5A8_9BACT|nr:ATP-binding cassette domain-containing protein [Malaciobacter pacificus]QEP33549.1 PQQ-dependent alcohol dehydrogenase-associated ABC transporter, ATP-binding protein [Malaciobacter pacificus]GGD39321.1 2-phenylethanol ABC transporter ATP-binding protein [Malaciobacter pacificus]
MSKNILELKDVEFSYGSKKVLNNISFNIKEGSFSVLLGLNGAGKSTVFSLITRLLKLQVGKININQYPINEYSKALKDIGIVFQEPTLDLDLTVKQNLYYYGSLKGLNFKQTLESIGDEIVRLELQDSLDTPARRLNGGHRRRVEILRALINRPKLLLLDEPTVGLDLKSRFDILEYVRDLVKRENLSVLWITHLFDEVNEEDDISFIKTGQIVEAGIVKDIVAKYEKENLVETFNHLVR